MLPKIEMVSIKPRVLQIVLFAGVFALFYSGPNVWAGGGSSKPSFPSSISSEGVPQPADYLSPEQIEIRQNKFERMAIDLLNEEFPQESTQFNLERAKRRVLQFAAMSGFEVDNLDMLAEELAKECKLSKMAREVSRDAHVQIINEYEEKGSPLELSRVRGIVLGCAEQLGFQGERVTEIANYYENKFRRVFQAHRN